ncbi:MAG TPA: PQQ-binding-like beta-propeller repeat protein [Vicinamibacteria bacterium]
MLLLSAAIALLAAPPAPSADWSQWRGPRLTGASPETGLPVRWGKEENVAWRLELPSHGAGTPIVSGDTVFLGVVEGEAVHLWSIELGTGAVRWKRPLGAAAGHAHKKHNMATPSPATDGKRVFAMTGAGVLKGFDVSGVELWTRDFQKEYGPFGLNWGYGSSPLLQDGALYVIVIHGYKTDDPSYVVRLDPETGKTRWKVERPTSASKESPDAYTTPTVARVAGRTEIVVAGADVVTGHDPATGRELWRAAGLNPTGDPYYRIVASPLALGDLVIVPTRVRPMLAVKAGGKGDVTESSRVWSFDQGPDVPSPASDGEFLYVVTDKGMVYCLDPRTGKVHYGPERLRVATYSASPLVADGKVYVTSEDGLTSVLRAGPKFEVLAENGLDDFTLASPVAVRGGRLLLRTSHHLYCVGGGGKGASTSGGEDRR